MPLGGAKIPDAEIALIRDWIQQGLLETATSQPQGPVGPSLDFKPTDLNRPEARPRCRGSLAPVNWPEPARANPVTALAASPWAPLLAVAGHERIYLYDLDEARAGSANSPFPKAFRMSCASAATAPRCWPPAATACSPAKWCSSM